MELLTIPNPPPLPATTPTPTPPAEEEEEAAAVAEEIPFEPVTANPEEEEVMSAPVPGPKREVNGDALDPPVVKDAPGSWDIVP